MMPHGSTVIGPAPRAKVDGQTGQSTHCHTMTQAFKELEAEGMKLTPAARAEFGAD